MVTLVKLGGSLITDKTQRATLRPVILRQLALEVRQALDENPQLELVLGHGSGSFGHFEAREHDTINGVRTPAQWVGFARVGQIASELNYHVAHAFHEAGVPALRLQPSASAIADNGVIKDMAMQPIFRAIEKGIIPLVYGDIAFDDTLGGTIISTETVFAHLVSRLSVKQVFLLGEVDGVYDADGEVIPKITADNFKTVRSVLGGSDGVDVTGGMLTKVQDMLSLAMQAPYPNVYVLNGLVRGRLLKAVRGEDVIGTHISQA
ncbi:MAG: isopentenyl phosphate kinase [Anaerolineae bacterium]